MGAEQNKQKGPPVRPLEKQETIIQLKMQSKRFNAQAEKADKERQLMIEKARREMKKNNEEMAKMYLNQAAIKQNESTVLPYRSLQPAQNGDEDGCPSRYHKQQWQPPNYDERL